MKKLSPGAIVAIIICAIYVLPFFFFISPLIGLTVFALLVFVIIKKMKKNTTNETTISTVISPTIPAVKPTGLSIRCNGCGAPIQVTEESCSYCGTPFAGNNVMVTENVLPPRKTVPYHSFDPMFRMPEQALVEEFIKKELIKAGINPSEKLVPIDALKRKKIFNVIFSILLFIYVCLIFFHFPILTYIIGAVLLFIFYILTRRFNIIKYLNKQIKARPSEKISNIVMNTKANLTIDSSRKIFAIGVTIAVILPMILFIKPVILYEKVDNGYAVRYYAFGVTNFKTVTIPETHKGENIVSLRGNTFSNMFFLENVTLPDSIVEIRGEAFKNTNIKEIKLPSNLEYLGGGAFYNCKSLKSIEIPDTVTYMGGEIFYNATSLESVKLSKNTPEIKGNSFENCSSLKTIQIPDSVTRIGGHAFYGCSSLSEVTFTENSKLTEIGSSAFRRCYSLYQVYLPKNVSVNQRAFKESPTEVKTFSQLEFDKIVGSNNYTYDTYIHISTGEAREINKSKKTAKLQNAYISLEKVNVKNYISEFTLKYYDTNEEISFTLTKEQPYKIINENIAVEVSADYIFSYPNSVSLNIYYN